MFSLQQNQRTRGQNRFCLEVGQGKVAQTMYIHVSKCKNDKIKKKERKKNVVCKV
jgi:3-methyladenine DNA glycosylase Mpg